MPEVKEQRFNEWAFITAGNATFTVDNGKGQHYTFKVRHKGLEERDGFTPNGCYFVSLLTGPNNEFDYTYLGVFNPKAMKQAVILRLTRASRMNDDSVPVRVFRWAAWLAKWEQPLPAGYSLHHEGSCGRCGRTLTTPESVTSGIGPECRRILGL